MDFIKDYNKKDSEITFFGFKNLMILDVIRNCKPFYKIFL